MEHDSKQANKLEKLQKLHPEDVVPGHVVRKVDPTLEIEYAVSEVDMYTPSEFTVEDGHYSSMSSGSVFTLNPVSECSFVNICHGRWKCIITYIVIAKCKE